jgi:hypothetical protein
MTGNSTTNGGAGGAGGMASGGNGGTGDAGVNTANGGAAGMAYGGAGGAGGPVTVDGGVFNMSNVMTSVGQSAAGIMMASQNSGMAALVQQSVNVQSNLRLQ